MALPSIFPVRMRRVSIGAFIPPVTFSSISLVNALVLLAQDIARCPKPRVSQSRNAAVITRRIKALAVLFEVVKESTQPLPPSAVLSFNELYIMLQRTKLLLQDCNEGSRFWLLMQGESLACQLLELTQDMATALDVLPLKLLDVSEDVREQVELVHRQARRAKVSVDPVEQGLRKDVISVLDEFERKVTPDKGKLEKIFEHLQIKDGRDCRDEIQHLEEEISDQSNGGKEVPVSLINSLISLVRYCKCVLFGVAEIVSPSVEKFSNAENSEEAYAVPDDFRCPISLDLMRDPVIVSTGQTYDRFSITRWIDEGHSTCPKSGLALSHTNVIPNYALRNLIQRWCEEHGVPFEKPEKSARSASLEGVASTRAALEATKMTAAFLVEKLTTGTAEVKKQVAYELRLLAKCGMDNRACIAEAGAIPLLVPLLASEDAKTQENAVTALLNLSIFHNNKALIMEAPGSLDSIVDVLKGGRSVEAKENAAATLFSLSSVTDYKKIIGDKPGAIPALVELLRHGTPRGKRDAVSALFNLSIYRGNDAKVVEAGAVPLLVGLLGDDYRDRPGLSDDALAVLAVLGGQREGLVAIGQTPAIPVLVGLLRSASPKGKENSIAVLLALCRCGGAPALNSVLRIPTMVPSVYTLLTSGTPRAKRKATSFLKMLQRCEHGRLSPDAAFSTYAYNAHSRTAITVIAPLR
uniref:RING-type E3 ubiquitin transferase n=1 Tax=Araucaria cunninghamii TaxID=56994 RepID=A0A0D6QWD0_ARACU